MTDAILEIVAGATRRQIPPGQTFVVGRDEAADLQVVGPLVSRRHLIITSGPDGWTLEDTSQNGSYVAGRRVDRMTLAGSTTISLGAPSGAPEVTVVDEITLPSDDSTAVISSEQRSSAQGRLSAVHAIEVGVVRIGRGTDNDVILDDLEVSRHHAALTRDASGWALRDEGSANGTFVNGGRITRCRLTESDVVGIGHALLHLRGQHLVEYSDVGEVAFSARDLTVTVSGGKTLLHGVTFGLEQRSLLAVVGPSGAGKSTLLRALTGFRPADKGNVQYAGRDLYADYDELRRRIGLVPQDDILHPQLTVRRALDYAARLRFPLDVGRADRERRIAEVLAELGLTAQADQRITQLSGGQRKRTSVALELLTRPSLLFLDEPTSGLDPGLDKSVMGTLRGLADDGRTVVVVTHSVAHLEGCDRLLLLAPGGSVAFFGPPDEALRYFGQPDFADLFLLLEREPDAPWASRFRSSPEWSRYVSPAVDTPVDRDRPSPARHRSAHVTEPRRQSAWAQFRILAQRYLAVIAADRQYVVFMVTLPLVLSLLSHALPQERGLSMASAGRGAPNSLLLVFVLGAALMGSAASIRELVKEREIYRRERAIGLSRAAYLASKLVVLSVVAGTQGVLLTVLGVIGRPPPDAPIVLASPTMEIVLAVVGVAVASMTIGLFVSAAVDNADRGMPLLVLLAMLQFLLSSALLQTVTPPLAQLSWFVPARWGFAAGASTIGLPSGVAPPFEDSDPLWDHTDATWLLDMGVLVVLAAVFVVGAGLLLRRLEPRRPAAREDG